MAWDRLAELKRNAPWLFLVSLSARCPPSGVSVPIDQTCPPAWMPIDLRVSTTGGWWTVTLSVHWCTGGHTECPPLGVVGSVTDRCPAGVRCCSPLWRRHLNQAEYSHIWCPLLYITRHSVPPIWCPLAVRCCTMHHCGDAGARSSETQQENLHSFFLDLQAYLLVV